MDFQIMNTESEYEQMLNWIDNQFDLNLEPDSEEGKQLQTALLLIKQYEDLHYLIPHVSA